jgi:hypothetical protein
MYLTDAERSQNGTICKKNVCREVYLKERTEMSRNKPPKFGIGDVVIISLYGTVGKVTSVKLIDNIYVYEVNNHEGLYVENTLQLISDYESKAIEKEAVELNYYFTYGDLVKVVGYEKDIFRVVGYRTEVWRYKNDAWEDTIYELSRITDGEWLEADEADLTLVANTQTANLILRKLKYDKHFIQKLDLGKLKTLNDLKRNSIKIHHQEIIDNFLDLYNDYATLYNNFQDEEYKVVMNLIINNLLKFSKDKK